MKMSKTDTSSDREAMAKVNQVSVPPLLYRRRVSAMNPHDTDRAEANWSHCTAKVRSIGFFSRHVHDKTTQRVNLLRLLDRMKTMHEDDKADLENAMKESIDRIHTMRPRSAEADDFKVPDPEEASWKPYEVKPGTACALCNEYFHPFRENDGYPCRICDDVFHKDCLQKCGDLHSSDLMNLELAKSNVGWSCPACANLSLLLTDKEVSEMTAKFENCDVDKNCFISPDEYINYKTSFMTMDGLKVTEEDKTFFATEFKLMDQNGDGLLDWWEFVNHESKMYLARRTKRQLLCLLTEKEVIAAKATFNMLDIDRDGHVKEYEAVKAYRHWYRNCEKRRHQSQNYHEHGEVLDLHAHQAAKFIMEANNEDYGEITWQDYILDQALYILSTRPNMKIQAKQ